MWKESWCWNAAGALRLHHSLPFSAARFHFTCIPSPNQVFNFSTWWAPARRGDKNEQGTELELAAALWFLLTLYFPLPRVMVKHRLCCSAPFGVVSVAWRFMDLQRVIISTPRDLPGDAGPGTGSSWETNSIFSSEPKFPGFVRHL